MTKSRKISQNEFEKLLDWLDADREVAACKYESIRRRLIKVFTLRGCHTPDELADTTIDIVTVKIDSVTKTYDGDQALYFYGVGRKVYLQYLKNLQRETSYYPTAQTDREKESNSEKHECLEKCLEMLERADRELIVAYYRNTKQEKIDERKRLADNLEISTEKLRVRIYRIKNVLEKCVRRCLKNL